MMKHQWYISTSLAAILATGLALAVSLVSAQPAYNIEQSVSDEAQINTIAFDGLAFMTNNLGAQAFLPPGKVADYSGFQFLRDNDPTQLGHNTDFVTIIAFNILHLLAPDQIQTLIDAAGYQIDEINQFAYQRYPLLKAFRRELENDLPAGDNMLSLEQVKQFTGGLYEIDGAISYGRARIFGQLYNSLSAGQMATLASLQNINGIGNWNTSLPNPLQPYNLSPEISVAVMTYASEFYSWVAGSVEADVYFCPERHGTYFGSFYLKDWPAMGNPDYTINEQLTAIAGMSFLNALSPAQKGVITDIVEIQRQNLYSIVDTRQAISQLLREFLAGQDPDSTQVIQLSQQYGELEGAMVYNYAMHFANVKRSLSVAQQNTLTALADSLGYLDPPGGFLYSAPIAMPEIANTDFLFTQGVFQPLPDTGQNSSHTDTFGEDCDYQVNMPDLTDLTDGIIKDNITGLYWQKNDGGEMTWENARAYAANLNLGGYSDWRLPTAEELYGILNHGLFPAIDTQFFPLNSADYWWSCERSVADTNKVWVANSGGGIGDHPRNETVSAGGNRRFNARCVRGDMSTSLWEDNGDGTVTDLRTGLMWSQNAPAVSNWENALAICEADTPAGYADWRLPNIKELRTLADKHLSNPCVSPQFFPLVTSDKYWSSTTEHDIQRAWFMDLRSGTTSYGDKDSLLKVMPVRGGFTYSGVSDDDAPPAQLQSALAYPNPFDPSTSSLTIKFKNSSICIAKASVYNVKGQLVWTSAHSKGTTQVSWDGRDKNGTNCSSGIYIISLFDSGGNKAICKLMLIH